MPEQVQINPIYKFMKSNNLTKLDEKTFLDKYSAPDKAKEIHIFLASNKLTDLDQSKFYDTYLKKKEQEVSPYVSSKSQLPSKDYLSQGEKMAKRGFSLAPNTIEKGVAKDVAKDESILAGLYNTIVDRVGSLAGGVASMTAMSPVTKLIKGVSGKFKESLAGIPAISKEGKVAPMKMDIDEKKWRGSASGFVEKVRSSKSSKAFESKNSQFDVFDGGISMQDVKAMAFQAPAQLTDMAIGGLTGGSSFFVQSWNDNAKDLEELPNAAKLTDNQKFGYLYTQSIVQAALEKFSLDKITKNTGLTKKVQQKIASEVIEEFIQKGVKATGKEIEDAVVNKAARLVNKIKNVGIHAAVGFVSEGGTEGVQQGASDAIKLITNKISKNEVFNEQDIKDNFLKNIVNSAVMGGAMGATISGGIARLSNTDKAIRKQISELQSPEDLKAIQTKINEQVELGNITPQEAQAANIKAQEYATIAAKIPEEIDTEKKYLIIGGIEQKNAIQADIDKVTAEISNLDESLQKNKKSQLELLQAKLDQVNDHINTIVSGESPEYKEKDGNYFKVVDGEEIKISKPYYELATAAKEENNIKDENFIKEEATRIKDFADRVAAGEKMESPEDLQFYENNKTEIEAELQSKVEEVKPAEVVKEQSPEVADIEERRQEELRTSLQLLPLVSKDEMTPQLEKRFQDNKNKEKEINAKYDAELAALEVKPTEVITTKKTEPTEINGLKVIERIQDTEEGEPIYKVEGDKYITESGKEVKIAETRAVVTLSGMTEQERKKAIETRKEKTKVTPEVVKQNKLLNDVRAFFRQTLPQQRKDLANLNNLRIRAQELGLVIDKGSLKKRTTIKGRIGKMSVLSKVTYNSKAEGNFVIDESGKTLRERNQDVRELFDFLNDNDIFLDFKGEDKRRLSPNQLEAVIQDIVDGVPSKAANAYLDLLETSMEKDEFPLYDKTSGEMGASLGQLKETEQIGEPMSEEDLDKFLSEEAEYTPEEEQDLIDNIENLLYDYETTEAGSQEEDRPAATEPKEAITPKAEPAEVPKKAKPAESQAVKDYKEAVRKAGKKAKENAKKEFVDRNFDLIVEKLKINIKCPV